MKKNKRVLYVGNIVDNITTGFDVANNNNYQSLKEICGDYLCSVELGVPSFLEKLMLYTGGCTRTCVQRVLKSIEAKAIDTVFLSSSLLGLLAKKIKKQYPKVTVVTFFHNIERYYALEQIRVVGLKRCKSLFTMSFNELLTTRYSDRIILLNHRDETLLNKYYKRSADLINPISYEDQFKIEAIRTCQNEKLVTLFVGSAFFANIEGIQWYLENVQPFLHSKLYIVGKGMEAYKSCWETGNVEVHGYVKSLSDYYNKADVVVLPIFHGGGMKTKTAEAFMYGKMVIGTKEAFEGYDNIDQSFAVVCNDAESFIAALTIKSRDMSPSGFNESARNYFLNNNTQKVGAKKLRTVIED